MVKNFLTDNRFLRAQLFNKNFLAKFRKDITCSEAYMKILFLNVIFLRRWRHMNEKVIFRLIVTVPFVELFVT